MNSRFSAKQNRSRLTCNGGLGGFVQLEELAEVYGSRSTTPVENKRQSMNPFERIRKRKSVPSPIAIPSILESGVESAALTTGSVMFNDGVQTPPVPTIPRPPSPSPDHTSTKSNTGSREENQHHTSLASPKTPKNETEDLIHLKVTDPSLAGFSSVPATPCKSNSVYFKDLPALPSLSLLPLPDTYELPGSILLPNQGFDLHGVVADIKSSVASTSSSRSTRSSLDGRSSTQTKSPPSLSVASSPIQDKSDMLKVFGHREGKRPSTPQNTKSFNDMTIKELMQVLPECQTTLIQTNWIPAMNQQLKSVEGTMKLTADLQDRQNRDVGEQLENIKREIHQVNDNVVPNFAHVLNEVFAELEETRDDLHSASAAADGQEALFNDQEKLLDSFQGSTQLQRQTLITFIKKFNSATIEDPPDHARELVRAVREIIDSDEEAHEEGPRSSAEPAFTTPPGSPIFIKMLRSDFLARESEVREALLEIESWKAFAAEQQRDQEFKSAKLDSLTELIREKNDKLALLDEEQRDQKFKSAKLDSLTESIREKDDKLALLDEEIRLFKLDVKGYKRDAREHTKKKEAFDVLVQQHVELERTLEDVLGGQQAILEKKDKQISQLQQQLAALTTKSSSTSIARPSFASTSTGETLAADRKLTWSSISVDNSTLGGFSKAEHKVLQQNQSHDIIGNKRRLTINTHMTRPPLDRAITTGFRSGKFLSSSKSMLNLGSTYLTNPGIADTSATEPFNVRVASTDIDGIAEPSLRKESQPGNSGAEIRSDAFNTQSASAGAARKAKSSSSVLKQEADDELEAAITGGKISPKVRDRLGLYADNLRPERSTWSRPAGKSVRPSRPVRTDSLGDLIASTGGSGPANIPPPINEETQQSPLPRATVNQKETIRKRNILPLRKESLNPFRSKALATESASRHQTKTKYGVRMIKDEEADDVILGIASPVSIAPGSQIVETLTMDKRLPRLPLSPETTLIKSISQSFAGVGQNVPDMRPFTLNKTQAIDSRSESPLFGDPIKKCDTNSRPGSPRPELHDRYPSQGVIPSPARAPPHERYPSQGILINDDEPLRPDIRRPNLRRVSGSIKRPVGDDKNEGKAGSDALLSSNHKSEDYDDDTMNANSLGRAYALGVIESLKELNPPLSAPFPAPVRSMSDTQQITLQKLGSVDVVRRTPRPSTSAAEYATTSEICSSDEVVHCPVTPTAHSARSDINSMGRRSMDLLQRMDSGAWPDSPEKRHGQQYDVAEGDVRDEEI